MCFGEQHIFCHSCYYKITVKVLNQLCMESCLASRSDVVFFKCSSFPFFSFVIVDLFLKHIRHFHRFYSFVGANVSSMYRTPLTDNHELEICSLQNKEEILSFETKPRFLSKSLNPQPIHPLITTP